jgi:vacuolar-type H+-ATPase subunit I/STV1
MADNVRGQGRDHQILFYESQIRTLNAEMNTLKEELAYVAECQACEACRTRAANVLAGRRNG